jgi:Flp pilus assembly protein TadD
MQRLLTKKRIGAIAFAIRACLICVLALAAWLSVAAHAQQSSSTNSALRQEFEQWVSEGSQALQQGDNLTAEKEFRLALTLAPQSVELLNNLAIALARQGKDDEAIAIYQRA